MNFKSLLFGSAALVAAGTGAQAADLPVVEPVEYVRICDAFGTGFYYIPGTETCLRVSGRVRVEAHWVDGDLNDLFGGVIEGDGSSAENAFNNFTTRARGNVRLDARTQTDFGLVRAFINLQGTIGPSNFADNYNGSGFDLDQAYIQITRSWGTFTAGHVDSFFDAPFSSNTFGTRVGIDDPTGSQTLFGYTFNFGGPMSASVSLEDPATKPNRFNGDDDYEGQEAPDLVANLRYDGGWGTLFAAGALRYIHDVEPAGGENNHAGWAVNAGFVADFGMFAAGLTAGYSQGALGYITNDPGGLGDIDDIQAEPNEAWAIRGGLSADFTPTVSANLDASFTHVEEDDGFDDYDFWAVAANVIWSPVSGLIMGPEVAFNNIDLTDNSGQDEGGDLDASIWSVMWRIQRDF